MTRGELEASVGSAFTEAVRMSSPMELIQLQHELRKTQPDDYNHLQLVLLELRERDKARQ